MVAEHPQTRGLSVDLPLQARELLRTRDVARMLGCSPQQVRDLLAEGELPNPIRELGSGGAGHQWRTRELLDWIDAGCPRRDRWNWKASKLVKLDDLMELTVRQIARLQDELAGLETRRAAGEKVALVAMRR